MRRQLQEMWVVSVKGVQVVLLEGDVCGAEPGDAEVARCHSERSFINAQCLSNVLKPNFTIAGSQNFPRATDLRQANATPTPHQRKRHADAKPRQTNAKPCQKIEKGDSQFSIIFHMLLTFVAEACKTPAREILYIRQQCVPKSAHHKFESI